MLLPESPVNPAWLFISSDVGLNYGRRRIFGGLESLRRGSSRLGELDNFKSGSVTGFLMMGSFEVELLLVSYFGLSIRVCRGVTFKFQPI